MAINDSRSNDPQALRDLLDQRRRQLAEGLHALKARIREHGSHIALAKEPDDHDPTDLDVVLVDIATATLRRVDHALERLADGEYGTCARCRRAIGEARLRALPFAVRCQQCETLREREEIPADLRPGRKSAWADWRPADPGSP